MYERLRSLREDKDLTQTQIAKYLHMSQTGYSQYEIGKNDIPTRILIQLAEFYDVPVDYLLNLTDVTRPYPRAESQLTKKSIG